MGSIINDLNNAKPGDIFISQTGHRLEYVKNQGDGCKFPHLFKLKQIVPGKSLETFVSIDMNGIPCYAFQGEPKFWISYKLRKTEGTFRVSHYVAVNVEQEVVAVVCKNNHGYDDIYGARQPEFKVVKTLSLSKRDKVIVHTHEALTVLEWANLCYPSPDTEGISKDQKHFSEKEVSPNPFKWEVRTRTLEL